MKLKIVRQCKVVDALAAWGCHEGQGRLRHLYSADDFLGENAKINGVDVAVTCRARMVGLVLKSQPVACLEVELAADDVPYLLVFDGKAAGAYADGLLIEQSDSGEHVRKLANADEDVAGALICIARVENQVIQAPLVTFDGSHRLAAWIGQLKRKQPYPINAYLILTEQQVEFWR